MKKIIYNIDIQSPNKITIGKNSLIGAFFNFESKQEEVIIGENTFIHEGAKLIVGYL